MPKVISDPSIYYLLEEYAMEDFKNSQYLRLWPHLKLRWIRVTGVRGCQNAVGRLPSRYRQRRGVGEQGYRCQKTLMRGGMMSEWSLCDVSTSQLTGEWGVYHETISGVAFGFGMGCTYL